MMSQGEKKKEKNNRMRSSEGYSQLSAESRQMGFSLQELDLYAALLPGVRRADHGSDQRGKT